MMDIEKLIERLEQYSEDLIAYKLGCNFADACTNAATALSTLQAENEKLRAELEQTKLEKETLIEAVRGDCDYCKNDLGNLDEKSPCRHCEGFAAKEFVTGDYWQWRGPEEEIKNG